MERTEAPRENKFVLCEAGPSMIHSPHQPSESQGWDKTLPCCLARSFGLGQEAVEQTPSWPSWGDGEASIWPTDHHKIGLRAPLWSKFTSAEFGSEWWDTDSPRAKTARVRPSLLSHDPEAAEYVEQRAVQSYNTPKEAHELLRGEREVQSSQERLVRLKDSFLKSRKGEKIQYLTIQLNDVLTPRVSKESDTVVSELLAHRKLMHLRTFRQHVFNSRVAANEGKLVCLQSSTDKKTSLFGQDLQAHHWDSSCECRECQRLVRTTGQTLAHKRESDCMQRLYLQ